MSGTINGVKTERKLSKEEINAVFENVAEFYSESFRGQFSQQDFDTIVQKTMQITTALAFLFFYCRVFCRLLDFFTDLAL